MDTEEAVTEFVNLLRLGTRALREITTRDTALGPELEAEINQLLYLADNIDDIGETLRNKTRALRRG